MHADGVRVGAAEGEGRLTRRWVSELRRLTGRASDPLCWWAGGERSRKRLVFMCEAGWMYEQASVVGVGSLVIDIVALRGQNLSLR